MNDAYTKLCFIPVCDLQIKQKTIKISVEWHTELYFINERKTKLGKITNGRNVRVL